MFKDQVLKKEPEGSLPVLSLSAGIKAMVAFRKGQDFKQETWRDKLFSSFYKCSRKRVMDSSGRACSLVFLAFCM